MTILLTLLPWMAVASPPPADVFEVSITLDAEELKPRGEYEILVEVAVKEGWSATDSGMPQPILQIKTPRSVVLDGDPLTTLKELSRNEFLQAPFEMLIEERSTRIAFTLKRGRRAGDAIFFNLLAYVSRLEDAEADGAASDGWLIRQRYELPLEANATATLVPNDSSAWGKAGELQLGDKAANFKLPRADGSKVSLKDYRGEKNVVVTTYRAHW